MGQVAYPMLFASYNTTGDKQCSLGNVDDQYYMGCVHVGYTQVYIHVDN